MSVMSNKQQALWRQGQHYTQQQRWAQAASTYQTIVDYDPNFLPAWLELSTAKENLGAYCDGRKAVLAAAAVPNVPPIMGMAVARRLRRFEANSELHEYEKRNNLGSRVPPEKLVDLATFFSSAGCHDYTLPWMQHALRLRPDFMEAHNMRGLAQMFAGDLEQAAASFERVISLKPSFAPAYSVLSRVSSATPMRNHVPALRSLLSRSKISDNDEAHLGYALHNELHDLGEYDAAWEALQRACRAKLKMRSYDHANTILIFNRLRQACDGVFCQSVPIHDPLTPIFIVGMHRTGTTLLERMLSGHPQVADAGETYTFPTRLRIAADHFCNTVIDLHIAERLERFDYAPIGRGFLDDIRWRTRGERYITEKLNPNFILLGPIAKSLPNARLLHMRRNALDTCFSNLRTLFTTEATYSYDMVNLADYYHAYDELMGHWRKMMPDRLLDIEYEQMVTAPDAEAARIAAHCGFEFTPEMLQVDRKSGNVATASFNQVRQGIDANRGGAWRPYEKHLGPLIDRLTAHQII